LAIILLLVGEYGLLTMPGIVAAVAGIICTYKNRTIAALIGITAATSSFIGQYSVVFCPYCFISAMMFAFAGTLCLIDISKEKPLWSLILIPMMTSLILLSFSILPEDNRTEIITPDIYSKTTIASGAKLYISVSCPSCKEVIPHLLSLDKEGKSWQPVIIPTSALSKGEKMLREQGYQGVVYSAPSSPNNKIPCLQNNNDIISGSKKIKLYTEKLANLL